MNGDDGGYQGVEQSIILKKGEVRMKSRRLGVSIIDIDFCSYWLKNNDSSQQVWVQYYVAKCDLVNKCTLIPPPHENLCVCVV